MEFDIKGFIIALLLGVLSGLGFANIFDLDFSDAITTAGTFMAGVGALGTLYVAAKALNSWKDKSNYDLIMKEYDKASEDLGNFRTAFSQLSLHVDKKPEEGTVAYQQWFTDSMPMVTECMYYSSRIRDSLDTIRFTLSIKKIHFSELTEISYFFREYFGMFGLMSSAMFKGKLTLEHSLQLSEHLTAFKGLRDKINLVY